MPDSFDFMCKRFADLTPHELYAILQLRIAVFMVEQKCLYTEADGYDEQALHLFAWNTDRTAMALYTRLIPPNVLYHGVSAPVARIGRVAIHASQRGKGLGHTVMKTAVAKIAEQFGAVPIVLSAQAHLQDFYQTHGFVSEGAIYDEDGIPHRTMVRA